MVHGKRCWQEKLIARPDEERATGDGSFVTWGAAQFGGDSSSVQDQLKSVQQIQACGVAFAAILRDGSVVTWGSAHRGGDRSSAQDKLKSVQHIQASKSGFAAILREDLSSPGAVRTMEVTPGV